MTELISSIEDWQCLRASNKFGNRSIGFVPTMGALHAGHLSLFARARDENDLLVASLVVNPTQFDRAEDLANYPGSLEEDHAAAHDAGVDYLFAPNATTLYPDDFRFRVQETAFSTSLCGKSRNGHFDGVLSVVLKLFNLVQPDRAYFGEKDFQQLSLIEDMVAAFFLDVDVIGCPTVREQDGLALSSRNRLLSAAERSLAPQFYHCLHQEKTARSAHKKLEERGFRVDYVEDIDERRFGAVFLENVRLIDNVKKQDSI